MTMPGLPKMPSANKIDLVEGKVMGLFRAASLSNRNQAGTVSSERHATCAKLDL